jgi:hypothetical protein
MRFSRDTLTRTALGFFGLYATTSYFLEKLVVVRVEQPESRAQLIAVPSNIVRKQWLLIGVLIRRYFTASAKFASKE